MNKDEYGRVSRSGQRESRKVAGVLLWFGPKRTESCSFRVMKPIVVVLYKVISNPFIYSAFDSALIFIYLCINQ